MSRRTILHIITTLEPAGAQTQLLGLCRHMDHDRYRFLVAHLLRRGPDPGEALDGRVEIHDLSANGGLDLLVPFRLLQLIERERVNLIHTHLVHAGVVGKLAAILRGRLPVVTTRHYAYEGKSHAFFYRLEDRLTSRCDRVIAVSEAVRRFLLQHRIAREERIIVIPNAVDTELFDPERIADGRPPARSPNEHDAASAAPSAGASARIGTIGRLETQKGQEHLLDAMPEVLRHHPDATLEIVGQGRLRAVLEEQARRLGIYERVRFLGATPHAGIPAIIARWGLFVLPSLWEGFGIAAAEAMAMEKAVVGSAVEGTVELVENGVTGILVPPARPEELADAISRLLSDRAARTEMGQKGRQRIVSDYSTSSAARKLEEVYAEVLGLNLRQEG